ncbi:MAG: lipocalin family protein [Chitinophagaceae bacterium]|nr:lipocalin family protein [Chitinophagaceae bacterium]
MAAILFTACGGSDKKEGDPKAPEEKKEILSNRNGSPTKLEGSWEIKRAEGDMASTNMGTVYEFKGSKLAFGKGDYKNPGSTEVTDSTFSFQADGNQLKFYYNYHFNGDTLVVSMKNGVGQVFHMVKQ